MLFCPLYYIQIFLPPKKESRELEAVPSQRVDTDIASSLSCLLGYNDFATFIFITAWKKKKHASSTGCALSLLSLAIITLFFVVGTVIISFLFPLNSKDTKIILQGNHTMELNPFIADKWWVKSMAVWIDPMTPNYKCPGEVTVVSNMMECGKLPRVYVVKEGGQSPNYLYALPGSVINITVPDNTRLATTNIWFTSNIETYIDLAAQLIDGGNEFRCNNINTPGAYCYPTKHYLGRTLNFQIKESGFYFYLLTNNSDSDNITPGYIEGIRWSYQLIHYNYSSIMANYDVKSYSISSSPASIRLSHFFHFGNAPSCVLFNFDCTPLNNRPQLEISNFRRRMDVVSLSVLVYVSTVVIISCVCLIPTSSVLIWLRRLS